MWWRWWGDQHQQQQERASEADELRARKKQLAREIAAKKLAIKQLRRSIRARRDEKFKEKVAGMPARIEQVNIDGLGRLVD
jgi:enoyl-CoA hydratase/carnithine racemase